MKAPNSNFSGLRFINCKSGKDRTGMAASLEQIQILSREYDLAEHEYQKALDAMRRLVCNLSQFENMLLNHQRKSFLKEKNICGIYFTNKIENHFWQVYFRILQTNSAVLRF